MITTRSPTCTRPGWATSTTSPAPSWPIVSIRCPAIHALYSVHIADACTLTSTQSSFASGTDAGTRSDCRSPTILAFILRTPLQPVTAAHPPDSPDYRQTSIGRFTRAPRLCFR